MSNKTLTFHEHIDSPYETAADGISWEVTWDLSDEYVRGMNGATMHFHNEQGAESVAASRIEYVGNRRVIYHPIENFAPTKCSTWFLGEFINWRPYIGLSGQTDADVEAVCSAWPERELLQTTPR